MPIDYRILQQVGQDNPLAGLTNALNDYRRNSLEEKRLAQQTAMGEEELYAKKLANMSARDKARAESTLLGAAYLDTHLASNDTEGARRYLTQRRQELGQRIANGENVDTTETDEALQMLESPEGVKQLHGISSRALQVGKMMGFIKPTDEDSLRQYGEKLKLAQSVKGDDPLYQAQIEAMRALASQRSRMDGPGSNAVKPPIGYRFTPDGGQLEPIPGGPYDRSGQGAGAVPGAAAGKRGERLPAAVQNIQDDAVNTSNTALTVSNDADAIAARLEKGDIELGPVDNMESQARNWAGKSNANSIGFQELESLKEQLRNATLLLAKGVQTEGDAKRALDQLFANTNDNKVVASRLRQIAEMNRRNAALYRQKVNNLRGDIGFEAYPFEGYDAIIGKPSVYAKGQQDGREAQAVAPGATAPSGGASGAATHRWNPATGKLEALR